MSRLLSLFCRPAIAAALVGLTACAPVAARMTGPERLAAPIDLGDYANGQPNRMALAFGRQMAARYGGTQIQAALADLAHNGFDCTAPDRAGRSAAEVCRRQTVHGMCTHVWRVQLFAAPKGGEVARAKGLYDRTCGEELLGGN